ALSTTNMATIRATNMAPIHSRVRSMGSALEPPETPLPARVIVEGLVQRGSVEFRPTLIGHPQLRIGDLPQEEVTDPHLAGRADQQVRVRHSRRVQGLAD